MARMLLVLVVLVVSSPVWAQGPSSGPMYPKITRPSLLDKGPVPLSPVPKPPARPQTPMLAVDQILTLLEQDIEETKELYEFLSINLPQNRKGYNPRRSTSTLDQEHIRLWGRMKDQLESLKNLVKVFKQYQDHFNKNPDAEEQFERPGRWTRQEPPPGARRYVMGAGGRRVWYHSYDSKLPARRKWVRMD